MKAAQAAQVGGAAARLGIFPEERQIQEPWYMLQTFQQRRQRVFNQMSPASAALFFSAKEQRRSRDVCYPFHQDNDFYYLCGFTEPQALLVLLKENDSRCRCILFNRSADRVAELWHGRRLGQPAAPLKLGIEQALPYESITETLPKLLNRLTTLYHAQGRYRSADNLLFSVLETLRKGKPPRWQAPTALVDWQPWLQEMRLFKSAAELDLMRQASLISAAAHQRAMQQCRPGLFEYHLEAEIHHEFVCRGARYPAYNTIVGGGSNGCILHYTDNDAVLNAGDLVLVDAGCLYQGYVSDITRTFPINGRFTSEQAALYDLVLKMQTTALRYIAPGSTLAAANEQATQILVAGLVQLGLLQGEVPLLINQRAHENFYMHGLGHWLGMDVHDVGDHSVLARDRILEPGMVLTVEPGVYIDPEAAVPAPYRGMSIRIEDSVVITADGYEILTSDVPKERAEIEKLMRLPFRTTLAEHR